MHKINDSLGFALPINSIGSMYTLFFAGRQDIYNFDDAKTSDTNLFARYFQGMLQRGIYLAPSQYESLFISTAIEAEHIEQILVAHKGAMEEIRYTK
jgi:glutamate-1-semialdehyde 2,1-aminomutase